MIKNKQDGFTLIEILVVIGIIAILSTVVLIAINPARQFKQARDSQRVSNINAILNAVGQNIADNKGVFSCGGVVTAIPLAPGQIMKAAGGFDIRPCIVPVYMSDIPVDPTTGTSVVATYDTGYTISRDATTDRAKISAVGEITNPIAVER